jgi:hypothetical protein
MFLVYPASDAEFFEELARFSAAQLRLDPGLIDWASCPRIKWFKV